MTTKSPNVRPFFLPLEEYCPQDWLTSIMLGEAWAFRDDEIETIDLEQINELNDDEIFAAIVDAKLADVIKCIPPRFSVPKKHGDEQVLLKVNGSFMASIWHKIYPEGFWTWVKCQRVKNRQRLKITE